jgi:hypothetical protein
MFDRDLGAASIAAVTEKAAAHAFDQLEQYNGKTNSWGARGALISTVGMLRGRYGSRRCDSDGAGDCERCQVMFLVTAMERLLAASADGRRMAETENTADAQGPTP